MEPGILIAIIGACASIIGGIIIFISAHGKTKGEQRTALDKRIDDRMSAELTRVYARLDSVEKANAEAENVNTTFRAAVARVLRSIAGQWPNPHGPDLNPEDIAVIEDTMPPAWIRRAHPRQPVQTPPPVIYPNQGAPHGTE